jgi:integrase/recombinase XerC
LFIALDRAKYGHRLTGTAIYGIVKRAARIAGISEEIAPEKLRFCHIPQNDQLDELNPEVDYSPSNNQSEIVPSTTSIDTKKPYIFDEFSPNILTALLTDKRSLNTRRAYEKDLRYFFMAVFGQPPNEAAIAQFLQLHRFDAIAIVLRYKSDLIAKGLKESTINRRLSALKSLVNFAAKLGKCNWNLDDIQTETVQTYRDTTGIKPESMREMLLKIDRNEPKGKRDFAILRLLWDNALRRNEVVGTNIGDFDFEGKSLQILGKGRGSQKSSISLSIGTANAIQEWLSVRETKGKDQPLFPSLDPAHRGHRLTGTAIYQIVEKLAIAAGITKKMSPHRIRHSAITAALDATNGNVRKVQKLSRHKKLDTLMLYDDNRTNMQGEISSLLSDLI